MSKPNTCAPSSRQIKLERQLIGIQKHLASAPGDKMSLQRVALIEAELSDIRESA